MTISIRRLLALAPAIVLAQLDPPRALTLDNFVIEQTKVALSGILANSYSPESQFPGVIIASPATDTAPPGQTGGQNYYFQWTRDAALTVKTIINQFASGDASLEPFIKAYISNEANIQRLKTLSGDFKSGGLGEPKYYVNSTAFNGAWGRPQHDGPALRAIAIMGYLNIIKDSDYIKNITETVVKPDLDYVAKHWDQTGFDLWEEQKNLHFFTAMVQARALREGASFMQTAGDSSSATTYLAQEKKLAVLIDSFWNATSNTFDAQLNLTKPTGADCGNLLASIHGSDADAVYKPSSEKILASTSTLINEMYGLYPIDKGSSLSAVSIGRYASDVYDGVQSSIGNPWFLCTSAVAEVLHLAANEFKAAGTIEVTKINSDFFKKVWPWAVPGTNLTDSTATNAIANIRSYADQFLAIEQRHVAANFSMSEQFSRTIGYQQGARDLTWSYAAFVTASRARSGQLTYNFTNGVSANLVGSVGGGSGERNDQITGSSS